MPFFLTVIPISCEWKSGFAGWAVPSLQEPVTQYGVAGGQRLGAGAASQHRGQGGRHLDRVAYQRLNHAL